MATDTSNGSPGIDSIGADFEEEQIGFPPYWNPEEGRKFFGTVMAKDERDPDFVRYVIMAGCDLMCATGPSEDAEEVLVKKGEMFTCSDYKALPLDQYYGVEVLVTAKNKRKIEKGDDGKPRTLWVFSLRVSPKTKALLAQRREERIKQALAEGVPASVIYDTNEKEHATATAKA